MWRILRNRIVQRTLGIVLLSIAAVLAYAWFFWLVPSMRRHDPLWHAQFTRKTCWQETQKDIHRYGWTHDDFGEVGYYGGKSWAEWIMKQAATGQLIANCGKIGHKDAALNYITCNDPSNGKQANTETEWLGWWATNKQKSQLEWIQAGLRRYGVTVHMPPSETDYEPLLALLGNKSTNVTEKIPTFVKYNAFRWLRDSGFEVIPFAMSNLTAQTPPLVRSGVMEYYRYEQSWSKQDEVGRLELAPPPSDFPYSMRPAFYSPAVQFGAYGVLILPSFAGAVLLACSWRVRKKNT